MPLRIPRDGQFTITDLFGALAERISSMRKGGAAMGSLMDERDEQIDYCTREQAVTYFRTHGEAARNVAWIPDDTEAAPILYEDAT